MVNSAGSKATIDATRTFAHEDRKLSWFHTLTTFGLLALATAIAATGPFLLARIAAGFLEALLLLRAFILYHDHMHGALLRQSRVASALFHVQGVLVLNPPRVWTDTHNEHHANTARLQSRSTGTYELWTVDRWRSADWSQRLAYRLERHPVTILFGYATVFFMGMCVLPFVKNPKRYASSGLAAVVHIAIAVAVVRWLGAGAYVTAMCGPFFVACALGAYLFYVQHNFVGAEFRTADNWNHADAALEGSSYLKTGPVMQFFTGNIGYHHVHHLNARIPFYRLPEAMAALPALQNPGTSTLELRDVIASLKLKLWDPSQRRMVRFTDVGFQSVG